MTIKKMRAVSFLFLYLVLYANACSCRPVKPLNERSTELTWQAWLLVDQGAGGSSRHGDGGQARKKITPKSIFVVPNNNQQTTLPPCADGYQSDPGGNCVKISLLNQTSFEEFILNSQLSQFTADYEDEIAPHNTGGPLQFNIPFDEDLVEDVGENIAIVLTTKRTLGPTGTSSVKIENSLKRNRNRIDVDTVAAIFGVKPDEVQTTTVADLAGTEDVTTDSMETTTVITTTTEIPTTTETSTVFTTTTDIQQDAEETLVDGDAIFFKRTV